MMDRPGAVQTPPQPTPPFPPVELASLGQRVGSTLLDTLVLPFAALLVGVTVVQSARFFPELVLLVISIVVTVVAVAVVPVANGIAFRRGTTLGLSLAGARIVRANGDLSGFYHTYIRAALAMLSALPLGLGYWWAFWDRDRQTWHDKMMHTYVVRSSFDVANRNGTSARGAVIAFWSLVAVGVAIVALIGVGFAYARATAPTEAEQLIASAQNVGPNYAVGAYDTAVRQYPAMPEAYLGRSAAYRAVGAHDEAAADADKALQLKPSAAAHNQRGLARMELRDYAGAMDDFAAAMQLAPRDGAAYAHRGEVYFRQGNYPQALEETRLALTFGKSGEAHATRGRVRIGMGEFAEAVQEFDRALATDPKHYEAIRGRGDAYAALGRHQEALSDHLLAGQYGPTLGPWGRQLNLAVAWDYLNLQRFSEARTHFGYLRSPEAYYGQGRAEEGLSQYQAAAGSYAKAAELGMDTAELHLRLAKAAEQHILRYLPEGSPERAGQPFRLEAIQGLDAQAMRSFGLVIRSEPRNAEAYAGRYLLNYLFWRDADAQLDRVQALELGYSREALDVSTNALNQARMSMPYGVRPMPTATPTPRPPLKWLVGPGRPIVSLVFSPDGKELATATDYGDVSLWNAETGAVLHVLLSGGTTYSRWPLAFSPDGRTLAVGVASRQVKLWDLQTGRLLRTLDAGPRTPQAMSFTASGKGLTTIDILGNIRVWDLDAGSAAPSDTRLLNLGTVQWAVFSPDRRLLGVKTEGRTVSILDVETGARLRVLANAGLDASGGMFDPSAFSPDGKRFAMGGGASAPTQVWDVQTGTRLSLAGAVPGGVIGFGFSPDGRFLALGSSPVTIWDVDRGLQVRSVLEQQSSDPRRVWTVAFSPDGQRVASGDANGLVWISKSGTP